MGVKIRSGAKVDALELITNKVRSIKVGGGGGIAHSEGGASKRLVDCRGRSGEFVDELQFMWVDSDFFDYFVTSFEFEVDKGVIAPETPKVVAEQTFTNKSDIVQHQSFGFSESIANRSTFQHEHGFQLKVGKEFTAGVPFVANGKISVEATTSHVWKFGEANTTKKDYKHTFKVACPPHSVVVSQAIVMTATMNIPYKMRVSNAAGDSKESSGVWNGVSTYHLQQKVIQHPLYGCNH